MTPGLVNQYILFLVYFVSLIHTKTFFVYKGTVEDAGTETGRGGTAEAVSDRAAVDPEAAGNHCSSERKSHPG